MKIRPKAVCLLSGGLDSATSLYFALTKGYRPLALTILYGQRHKKEVTCAYAIARSAGVPHKTIEVPLPWKGSALLDRTLKVPDFSKKKGKGQDIPITYVPGRNTIFLALAVSWAEAEGARAVYIGANALDYSGYPDCRPAYFRAVQRVVNQGTKCGIQRRGIRIEAPLLGMTKKEIVLLAVKLGVPLEQTWSCYAGAKNPCGRCDSCVLRAKGFREAGVRDPLRGRA